MAPPADLAEDFFVSEVDLTVREFLGEYGCVRRGRLATIVLVHTADHFWHFHPGQRAGSKSEADFRKYLSVAHPKFCLLCDVANASKHAILRGKQQPLVTSADQVAQRSLGWGEATWDEGRWDGPPQVVVTLNDGVVRILEDPIRECHAMWCKMFAVALPELPA